MAEKKRLRMRGVKQASKREEGDILNRANELAVNPGLLRPMCAGNCRKCIFDKVFKDIDKASAARNDEKALTKYAGHGFNNMSKAYAGTISVAAAGKIPLLATAVIAGDRIPYVIRGSVPNGFLIGCQHYDDPKIRLLYYNDLIRAEKLHLYSWGENIVCSNNPNMPEDYLYDTWWESPYEFPQDKANCGHEGAASLNLTIRSLDETVHICADCAKNVSSLAYIVSRMCAINVLDDVSVVIRHAYHAAGEKGEVEIKDNDLKEYMVGKITDKMLIDKVRREKLGELSGGDSVTLVIGEKNYGNDIDGFLKAIDGDDQQKALVRTFLESCPGAVVIRYPKIADALAAIWDIDWHLVIEKVTTKDFADRNYTEKPKQPVIEVILKARRDFVSEDVVKNLPEFFKPGQTTRVADSLAKAAKVGGSAMMLDELTRCTIKDNKSRSVAAAMFMAVDPSVDHRLTLTKEDKEFAQFLVPFAKKVLDAEGENYRSEMNTLLMAACCGEKV